MGKGVLIGLALAAAGVLAAAPAPASEQADEDRAGMSRDADQMGPGAARHGGMDGSEGGRHHGARHHGAGHHGAGHHGAGHHGAGTGSRGARLHEPVLKIEIKSRGREMEFECRAEIETCLQAFERSFSLIDQRKRPDDD